MFRFGNQGDTDRDKWMDYDYKVRWSFKDGGEWGMDWKSTNSAAVSLSSPYEVRDLKIDGDDEKLKSAKVRYIVVKIEYQQFGRTRKLQIPIRPGDSKRVSSVPVVQERGVFDYNFGIEWVFEDGSKKTTPLTKAESDLILIDVIP